MTLVIAEAGVNHNGDIQKAFSLVDAAVASGADIIKFQTYISSELTTAYAPQAQYVMQNLTSNKGQLSMLRELELTPAMHEQLVTYCDSKSIEFLSTAFDFKKVFSIFLEWV